jgi:hypothetical protein
MARPDLAVVHPGVSPRREPGEEADHQRVRRHAWLSDVEIGPHVDPPSSRISRATATSRDSPTPSRAGEGAQGRSDRREDSWSSGRAGFRRHARWPRWTGPATGAGSRQAAARAPPPAPSGALGRDPQARSAGGSGHSRSWTAHGRHVPLDQSPASQPNRLPASPRRTRTPSGGSTLASTAIASTGTPSSSPPEQLPARAEHLRRPREPMHRAPDPLGPLWNNKHLRAGPDERPSGRRRDVPGAQTAAGRIVRCDVSPYESSQGSAAPQTDRRDGSSRGAEPVIKHDRRHDPVPERGHAVGGAGTLGCQCSAPTSPCTVRTPFDRVVPSPVAC